MYNGKKVIYKGSTIVYDEYGFAKEKKNFIPTKGYLDYLKEKERLRQEKELEQLKNSLDYQYRTYGEVDDVDFKRYLSMLGM